MHHRVQLSRWCLCLVPLVLACHLSADVAPEAVPAPNLMGKPVDYIAWYRDLLRPLQDRNAYETHRSFFTGPGDEATGFRSLSAAAAEQLDRLLASPHRWTADEYPDLAQAVRHARPALQALAKTAGKDLFAAVPPPDMPAMVLMLVPHLSYAKQACKLLLADGLAAKPDATTGPVDAMRIVLTQAKQLSYPEVPMPLIQQLVAIQIRQDVYGLAPHCLAGSLLDAQQIGEFRRHLRQTDHADLRQLLGSSLSLEQAFGLDNTQRWVLPGSNRFSKWMMRHYLEMIMPPLDTSLIQDARADRAVAAVRSYSQQVYECLQHPERAHPAARIEELCRQLQATSPFAAEFLASDDSHSVSEVTHAEAQRRGLHILLAAAEYRCEHKRWPESLTALLKASPDLNTRDPYAPRQEIKYRVKDDELRLYSVGPAGTDEGCSRKSDLVIWPPDVDQP